MVKVLSPEPQVPFYSLRLFAMRYGVGHQKAQRETLRQEID